MSLIDSIQEDIQRLRRDLKGINPKLSLHKSINAQIVALHERIRKLKLTRNTKC